MSAQRRRWEHTCVLLAIVLPIPCIKRSHFASQQSRHGWTVGFMPVTCLLPRFQVGVLLVTLVEGSDASTTAGAMGRARKARGSDEESASSMRNGCEQGRCSLDTAAIIRLHGRIEVCANISFCAPLPYGQSKTPTHVEFVSWSKPPCTAPKCLWKWARILCLLAVT